MVEIFSVEFLSLPPSDSGLPIFFAGQQVHANCHLKLKEEMKARDIKLKLIGRAKVSWKIMETTTYTFRNPNPTSNLPHSDTTYNLKRYKSEQLYLNQCATLWTSPDQTLAPGAHQLPFTFTIPPNAASTFVGEHGSIYYCCTVVIDRIKKSEKKVECQFVVSPRLDLNIVEGALDPIEMQTEQKVGFFRTGRIFAKVRIPQTGFVPGQEIPFQIEVENNSSKSVKKVKAKMLEKVTFMAKLENGGAAFVWGTSNRFSDHQERVSTREIANFKEKFSIKGKGKDTFYGSMVVPPCVPNFNNCSIIRLAYVLQICLNVGIRLEAQILVGTVPLQPNCQQFENVAGSLAIAPPQPPSYEEAKQEA